MKIFEHLYDLPDGINFTNGIAIDTESMGLKYHRDRLCLVQISAGNDECHLVHFPKPNFDKSPNICKIFNDSKIQKIFHFARFDVGILTYTFNANIENIYCTKIASFLSRTFSSKHSLKDLCKDLLDIELSKQEQDSDWGVEKLTINQIQYAANDVLYLHRIKEKLDKMLRRENRMEIAQKCFEFLPYRCRLDIICGENFDAFAYKND